MSKGRVMEMWKFNVENLSSKAPPLDDSFDSELQEACDSDETEVVEEDILERIDVEV